MTYYRSREAIRKPPAFKAIDLDMPLADEEIS